MRTWLFSGKRYCKLQGADAVHEVEGNIGCIDIARCSWTLQGQRTRAHTQAFARKKEKKCPPARSRMRNITKFLMKERGAYIRRFLEGSAVNRYVLNLVFLDYWDKELLHGMQGTKINMSVIFFDQPQWHFKFLF
jgi:hypothetical protein